MIERAYHQKDQDTLTELWLAHRVATSVKVYPTIWRSRLLLSSRVWDREHDSRVWQSQSGDFRAFAMLWRRSQTSSYIVLDYCIHPQAVTKNLFHTILEWGVERTQSIADEQKFPLTLFTQPLKDLDTHQILERMGLKRFHAKDQGQNLYFVRNLETEITTPHLQMEYAIEQLRSYDELSAS